MLTKLARTAAENPHAGNPGRKENCSVLTKVHEEGRKTVESGGVFANVQKFHC